MAHIVVGLGVVLVVLVVRVARFGASRCNRMCHAGAVPMASV